MFLKEYLEEHGTPLRVLARRANISHATIINILAGKDIRLSVALQIEDATKGQVKCRDLAPAAYHLEKINKTPKQK